MIVSGCIAKIGEPSTGSPCGANGNKVVFTSESIANCGKTFEGMPLNCTFPTDYRDTAYGDNVFTGHGDMNIGFIRKIKAVGNDLMAEIVIWKERFPAEAELILLAMDSLGFSCEWYNDATHEDMINREKVTVIDAFSGVGCALLFSNGAAFSQTYIEKIAASKEKIETTNDKADERVDNDMTKEELQEVLKAAFDAFEAKMDEKVEASKVDLAPIMEKVDSLVEKVEANRAEVEKNGKAFEDYVLAQVEKEQEQAKVEAENVDAKKVEASVEEEKLEAKVEASVEDVKDIPMPSAVQHVEPNPNVGDTVNDMEKIYANKEMSNIEKLRAISKARLCK